MGSVKSLWAKAGLLLTAVAGLAAAAAARGAEDGVTRVRFGGSLSETRVVLELDKSARGRLVETPEGGARRVVLALPNVNVGAERSGTGFGLVSGWRLEESAGAARLQLELRQDGRVVRRFLLPPADGVAHYRYVLDLAPGGAATSGPTTAARRQTPETARVAQAVPPPAPAATSTRAAQTTTTVAPPVRVAAAVATVAAAGASALTSVERPRATRRVVVIDAGHGGRDPGAIGATHRESAVTLRAAQALKTRLERSGYRVVMTRTRDTAVALQQRVRVAREARADLFISLHADAGPNAEARGASVYTLSDQGSNRVAQRVLSGDSWFMNVELPGTDRSVNQILLDLTQRATVNESARFAGLLLTGIGNQVRVRPSGHRNAGFVVLLAPDVPAVLLEMGFITNAEDERQLGSPREMRRLMEAVGDSIDRYFARGTQVAAM